MSLLGIARPHGRHRAVDEVLRLRSQLVPLLILICDLSRRLAIATAGWDAANAKASRLGDAESRAAEATRQLQAQTAELHALRAFKANANAVSDLPWHPAVAETQPIPVLPLHLSPLAGVSPGHVPGF
ncbi:hypothetical protein OG730_34725 [Streptomyces sp. NBC_01298]|uniref:hypothetical protein n=1 Tax=Streptomyces sp. NBC_01298 TaxID=2903817 RepID=UPI002E0E7444|nr:hypothetical protein OG730_34725 [Streptomyces sp. NBC_01298]